MPSVEAFPAPCRGIPNRCIPHRRLAVRLLPGSHCTPGRGAPHRVGRWASLGITVFLLAACAGFQGTRQVPLLLPVEEAAARDAGPWLTPSFAAGADGSASLTVSWITSRPMATLLAWGEEGGPLLESRRQEPVKLHRVELSGLHPGVAYRYLPEFGAEDLDSRTAYRFVAPDWNRERVTVAVLGDMQPRDDFTRRGGRIAARAVAESGADLVVQLGDVAQVGVFPSDWLDSLDDWSLFASSIPAVGVIGNHDYYGDPGRNFRTLFPYPYADPRAAYWSFDLAGAHFVMLDCFERDGHLSGAQKTWIEADLRAAASRGSRYRFLFLHLTPITTGTSETAGELERWLLPLADRSGVDAVFFGHDHHYEHWEVVYGNQGLVFDPGDRPAGQPIHYFCSGGGGAYLEIDYGLLTRKPSTFERRLYDRRAGQWVKRTYARLPWDSERFIDHTDDPEYGQLLDGKHYYHLPEEASYQGDADWLGYRYGEQTLHYLLIEIGPEEAIISAHYPSGELLTGPRGDLPQRFSIPARR